MDPALTVIATSLGHVMERPGVIAAALLAAVAVLAVGRDRLRAAAMLGALVLTPVLLVGDIWDSPQLRPLRHHPLLGAAALLGGLAAIALLSVAMERRREVLPLLVVAALPFRIPISAGGQTSNLLVPLYVVIAAGALQFIVRAYRDPGPEEPRPGRLEWLLMGLVVLYAIQASYSSDFTKALQQIVFFYVPFALLFALLRQVRWDRRLLIGCLLVLVGLAVIFVGIGFVEYSRRELLLNPRVISANSVESYFRVNSLFFDPNIYGRFLALVMLAVAAALLWCSRRRDVLAAAAALAVLWGGLMTSISQSSITALLVGLGVLAALRWNTRRTVATGVALLAAGGIFLLVAGSSIHFNLGSSKSADKSTSGRYTLIKGGVNLFGDRPLTGFGPGSFAHEYRAHQHASSESAVSASHTTPITVAAEQGILGLAVYILLLIACFGRLLGSEARGSPARVAIGAGFVALALHTMLYADFLEDPMTWTLLGVGTALWAGSVTRRTV
jgi:O-antigen ligase